MGSVQKHNNYHNSTVFDAPDLSQVPLSFLGFILLGFPPILVYKIILQPIGVKISSTVLEEYTFTNKEIHFEAIAVQGFLFREEFST